MVCGRVGARNPRARRALSTLRIPDASRGGGASGSEAMQSARSQQTVHAQFEGVRWIGVDISRMVREGGAS